MRRAGLWAVGVGLLSAAVLAAEGPPLVGDPPFKRPTAAELWKRYPFESIIGRLSYEPAGTAAFAKQEPPLRLTAKTIAGLKQADADAVAFHGGNRRAVALRLLHSREAAAFVKRDGSGFDRMPGPPSPFDLELPTGPTVLFEGELEAETPADKKASSGDKVPGLADSPLPTDSLEMLHQNSLFDFLDPRRFGYVLDRKHVSGFQSHQFSVMPVLQVPPGKNTLPPNERWAVIQLELVSLLKHQQPVAYVTNSLPRMDDVKTAQTRPLSAFEQKALKNLRQGDDVIAESSGDRIRMVGSLRATKQCLACHDVMHGALLGAFSWELQRQPTDAGN